MTTRTFPFIASRRRADGSLAYRGYADDANGDRIFSPTFDNPADAYKAALAMRAEAANGAPTQTLDEAVDKLMATLRLLRTPGTVEWYADNLRAVRLVIPGKTLLHRITRETVEAFMATRLDPPKVYDAETGELVKRRKCGPATVNANLRALHRVFAHAMEKTPGIVNTNPVKGVERPRADVPPMDWFADDELPGVLKGCPDQRSRDVVLLFALTGVRRSEAARLAPANVDLRRKHLNIPGKTGPRTVPIAPDLVEPCKRLLAAADGGPVLLPGGTHAIDELFRHARRAVGDRRLHPHALRHTFGTALVRGGARLDVVKRLMGHQSVTTTERYLHGAGSEGVEAVGRLSLGRPA